MIRLALLLNLAVVSHAQTVAPSVGQANPAGDTVGSSEVSFQFERPGLPVPKYSIVVHEDGTGTYQAQIAPVSGSSAAMEISAAAQPVSQPIQISNPTTQMIFRTARSLDRFNIPCESKAKNIADTGKKTLSYKGPDGQGSCLYNYSENKSIAQLTDSFQAIAQTMDEGRKLQFLHRFDRLGLYSEMDVLSHEVEEKRVLELGNIAPALRSIVADEAVMQKVRERAAHLLALAEEATPSSSMK
jgi:hypothetical protein